MREGLLRPRLQLKGIPVAALLIGAPTEVISDPGPFLAAHLLDAAEEQLVLLFGPGGVGLCLI